MPEQSQRTAEPTPWTPGPKEAKRGGGDDNNPQSAGPRRPEVTKPDTEELLKRMRRVDPNQSRRYRQRTGQ